MCLFNLPMCRMRLLRPRVHTPNWRLRAVMSMHKHMLRKTVCPLELLAAHTLRLPRLLVCPYFPMHSVHRQHSVQTPCWTGYGPSAACLCAHLGLHCAEYCVAPPPPCLPNIATSVSQQKGSLGQVMGAWSLTSFLLSSHVLSVLATQHALHQLTLSLWACPLLRHEPVGCQHALCRRDRS